MIKLFDHQLKALSKIHNGCILCGGTGSGKSITSLAYFYLQNGGTISSLTGGDYTPMQEASLDDLYIITTARKRDLHEWDRDMAHFLMNTDPDISVYKKQKVIVDSWNNIKKYKDVKHAFFIFDEQRVVGSGAWVKCFLNIAKNNEWILLSATPGDKWEDYIPVFLANGFYKNKTEFQHDHLVYSRFTKFPVVERYINEGRLVRLRNRILVPMKFKRKTTQHHIDIDCNYDRTIYKDTLKNRWNPYTDEPIKNASELCYTLRKIVNDDDSRAIQLLRILEGTERAIIFYNYDYELDVLKNLGYIPETEVAEWNGHAHQPLPTSDRWVYLVQYTAGCEGWNCTKTDTCIFYSQNYSYKVLKQAIGRIDRLNNIYQDLYYYHLKSKSSIDLAISKAINTKKKFNETAWLKEV